jgi:TRAP-type C4-dicarboxylate transport system substrate-binding protein
MRSKMRYGLALAALLVAAGVQAAPTKVKLGTLAPRGSSYHQSLQQMAEAWKKATGGEVQVTIYPDGAMGGEADVVRKMRVGQVQAAMVTGVGLSEIDQSVTCLQLMPMVFHSLEEFDYVSEKMRPLLEKRLLDKGFVVLFWVDTGWIHFFTKAPVRTPDDLKKVKLFSWAGDNATVDILKTGGFQAVPLETADILPGLQTGLIDGIPTIPFFVLSTQIDTHCPHMLELHWAPLIGGGVITKKAWDAMPESARAEMQKAAAEAGRQITLRGRQESTESIAAMVKRGLKVTPVPPELDAQWQVRTATFYPRIRGEVVPADLFDEVMRLLKEYRAQHPAKAG